MGTRSCDGADADADIGAGNESGSGTEKQGHRDCAEEQEQGETLIVAGSANCMEHELREALERFAGADIAAVNAAGVRIRQRIRWWVTYHPERIAAWRAERSGSAHYQVIGENDLIVRPGLTGTSVLLAVMFGLEQGYRRVHVVGAPMDDPHYELYHRAWEHYAPGFSGQVSAASGWLKRCLETKRCGL